MNIEGTCYCGAVKFSAFTHTPYPYMRCYCACCRKTSGGGGYGVNIMAQADSLHVVGKEHLFFRHGMEHDPETDELRANLNQRFFCRHCGSSLWSADPRWSAWIYPFASAIDTSLPEPPEYVHIMLDFKANWAHVPAGEGHRHFNRYPDESIVAWHKIRGLNQ